jgi:hypothetical protein
MTPRRHAVLATLAGLAAGAAIVAVVAVASGGPDPAPAGGPSASASVAPAETNRAPDPAAGPLDPTSVVYERKQFGTKTATVALEVPKGWKYVKQDAYNAWFTGPDSIWRIRVDATANPKTIEQMMVARERSLKRSTRELTILHRAKDSHEITWGPGTLTHRTLAYSYLNNDRGHRLVVNRFIALGDGGRTAVEITASGRPEDEPGLAAVLTQATTTLVLSD